MHLLRAFLSANAGAWSMSFASLVNKGRGGGRRKNQIKTARSYGRSNVISLDLAERHCLSPKMIPIGSKTGKKRLKEPN